MITREHVRALPDPRTPSVLVVLRGRARVVPVDDLRSGGCRGAVEVVSGQDLAEQFGAGEPSGADLDRVASTIEAMVAELGG